MALQRIYTAENINRLAKAFCAEIRAALTADELAEVNRRNKTERYSSGACATHDFMDANMPMSDAFVSVVGCEVDGNNEDHCDLWNAAWGMARESGFKA